MDIETMEMHMELCNKQKKVYFKFRVKVAP